MTSPEMVALASEPDQVVLSDGTTVLVGRLRTREFLKLLRILTRGAYYLLRDPEALTIRDGQDAKEWGQRLLTALVMALPEAEDETVEFLRAMVSPTGLAPGVSKEERTSNEKARQELSDRLANPDLDDTFSILEKIVDAESDDLVALGKRVAAVFRMAQKANQIPTPSQSTE